MTTKEPHKTAVFLSALMLAGLLLGQKDRHWHREHPNGIPILVGLNSVSGLTRVKVRRIVLLLDEGHFNEEDLTKVFSGLASIYQQPELLSIDAHTDRTEADDEIRAALSLVNAGVRHTEDGGAPRPNSETTLRAEYFRDRDRETFSYKDKSSQQYRTVILSPKH